MDEEIMPVETDDDEIITGPETDDDERPEKSVSADLIRGHINTIILRSLYDGDKYGYEIIAEIERKSSGQYSLKQPSLYSALKRLEKDGYITSYWGGSVGGGRRKYFSLTEEGKAVSEQNQAEWEYSRTIIDSLISDRDFDFNRPAPTAVDMSVLRKSTSRVPSSRDDEDGEEFSFEPEFDGSALKEQLEENAKQRQAELEASYDEKMKALEAEYAEKFAALDRDRADFESERARLEEEMDARERELADSYEANLKQLDLIRAQQEEAIRAQREAFEREKERFESEKAQFDGQMSEAQAEADEAIRNELELQKQKNVEAAGEHEQAVAALKAANEQALAEQREADEASLRAEREFRERALRELTERHERELGELSERHDKEMESLQDSAKEERETAVRAAREEENRRCEAQYQAEKARYSELLTEERNRYNAALAEESSRHEAQIRDDRARYQQALEEQLAMLRRQMEYEMAEREKQLIHNNFISLVNSPSSQQSAAPQPQPASQQDPVRMEENYRNVVGRLYENTVRTQPKPADVAAKPVSGIDFRDIENRAKRDGLHVETVGGETPAPAVHTEENVNTVHKGKALFLSAIAVFFWCVLVGGITIGLKSTLTIPVFYPYLMWGLGLVLLLTTGLMYANHFGANRLRKPTLSLINSIVIYALIVIVALIVALSVRIDFGDLSSLMTYVILPAIYFIGVFIFGLCYFLR